MTPIDVCLITPGHLASTPRLVKEATALRARGYQVYVVSSDHFAPNRPLDQEILAEARWTSLRIAPPAGFTAKVLQKLRRGLCQRLFRAGLRSESIATHALFAAHDCFVETALRRPARLYLAHGLPGLCIAAEAARRSGGLLGFDAEDWHSEEQTEAQMPTGEKALRRHLEKLLLPRCRHLTAASPLIAEAYAPLAKVAPLTVLNVFPLEEAPATPPPHAQRSHSLYWFSQTIGSGRGLEEILRAMPLLPTEWTLHLRGIPEAGFPEHFLRLAATLGLEERIHWLNTASPSEMARLASAHRIGLSVESETPPNRAACLTNKLFTYLLAGTPTLLSDTPAHRAIAPALDASVREARTREASARSHLDGRHR